MRVVWTEPAERSLDDIVNFIAIDNPAAAMRMDELMRDAGSRLADMPNRGRRGPLPGTRELLVHPHYFLVYRIENDAVEILAVIHTSRQWPPLIDP